MESATSAPSKLANRYYRLMTSDWLQKNATFSVSIDKEKTNQSQLAFSPDSSRFERLFRVQLIPKAKACRGRTVVRLKVGLLHTGAQDNISFLVANKSWAVGFQLTYNYTSTGTRTPYRPVEGKTANTLNNGNPLVRNEESSTSTQINPRVYELTFQMDEDRAVGICSSALDGGHMIITTYSNTISTSDELFLEAYRGEPSARYILHFVEANVDLLE